jgi:hypothetical protein
MIWHNVYNNIALYDNKIINNESNKEKKIINKEYKIIVHPI